MTSTNKEKLLKIAQYLRDTYIPNFDMYHDNLCVMAHIPKLYPDFVEDDVWDFGREYFGLDIRIKCPNCKEEKQAYHSIFGANGCTNKRTKEHIATRIEWLVSQLPTI